MSRDKDVRSAELRVGAAGLAAAGLAYLGDQLPNDLALVERLQQVTGHGYLVGGALLAGAIAHNRWYFSARQRFLRKLGEDGWLDRRDLGEFCGPAALRKLGEHTRPSLAGQRRVSVTEFGLPLGKLVSGTRAVRGRTVYTPVSRGIKIIGPQGSGKTSLLIHPLLDSPGATVVTSTKPELAVLTAQLRALRGPVAIFNPQQLGDLGSSLAWDPVAGCHDQGVADARAWALVRGGGGAQGVENSDFWATKAQEIVRCYLMAAALQQWDMGAVAYWAYHPDDPTPVQILEAHPQYAPSAWVGTLKTHLNASHNTRTGYFATVTSCIGFMDNPTVASACRPRPGEHFDVAQFLAERGTLYLIGGAEDRRIAPLLTALVEHLFGEAKRLAAASPHLRLDPPMSLLLDEVANITPVPLHQWAADSRGWGITVAAVLQDYAQLESTWGPERAKTIKQNLPTTVVLPGISDQQTLEELSYLAGEREVLVTSEGESRARGGLLTRSSNRSYRKERVISGHTIYSMPRWHALVLGLGEHPAVIRFTPGQRRAQRELRRLRRTAEPAPALAPRPAATTAEAQS